ARNAVMFGPGGRLYVYLIYGVHWCMNVSTGPTGYGAAVLLRAIEPRLGLDAMRARRGVRSDRDLARGPGRLTQALGVSDAHQNHPLSQKPMTLHRGQTRPTAVLATPRIGIRKAVETPWRFAVADSAFVSGPARLRQKRAFP
ncbi:MAG: DNA-3-methyladenine glycosylase, partial [Myxococcota bacterium]